MPLRINERPPMIFPIQKPREKRAGSTGSKSVIQPEKKEYLNKRAKQKAPPVEAHANYKPPSSAVYQQSKAMEFSSEQKSFADHFFQITRGTNKGSVSPYYHHKQAITNSLYFR